MDDETPTNQFPAYGPPPGGLPPEGAPPGAVAPGEAPAGRSPNRRRLLIAASAAVVVIAGAGVGVAVAASSDDDSSAGPLKGAPSSTTSGATDTGGAQDKHGKDAKKGKHAATRGTITAESGSTWTIKTSGGKSVKVTVTGDTKFGTKKAPAGKDDFTVGKQIVVRAAPGDHDGAVTARQVRVPAGGTGHGKHGGGSASSTPSSSPS